MRLLVRWGRHHDVRVQAAGAATLLRGILWHRRADAGTAAAGSACTAASGSACTAASGTSEDKAGATRLVTATTGAALTAASAGAAWWL